MNRTTLVLGDSKVLMKVNETARPCAWCLEEVVPGELFFYCEAAILHLICLRFWLEGAYIALTEVTTP
jgi:hypothetical protein